jgi:ubiquinone/menaquinone biosynthesis C-methylase UbiE
MKKFLRMHFLKLMIHGILEYIYFRFASSPKQNKFLIRLFYNQIATFSQIEGISCFNYGFAYSNSDPIELFRNDSEYLQKQLYFFLVSQSPCYSIQKLLEVGCGLGGGAAMLATKIDRIDEVIGVDLAPMSVKIATTRYSDIPNLKFLCGDAENLPIEDQSIDLVINVESSRDYPNLSKFFKEVHRALKHDGSFLITDFRDLSDIDKFEITIFQSGFIIDRKLDITENIKASLIKDNPRKKNILDKGNLPRKLGESMDYFYKEFMKNRIQYFLYVLKKAED